ncbi:MAG TPA: lipid kinase, partial [Cellvibrionaceae bacterium]
RQVTSKSAEETRKTILAQRDKIDFVIVGGGDGTLSSTAHTLIETKLPLAILPLGTANDLARSLGIPEELEEAFAVIAGNVRTHIDVGLVNDQHYFNVAHMGLGVKVTQELTPEVKKHWGVFSYLKAFFAALARIRQFRVNLEVDGEKHSLRSIQLAVGNGRYYGGGNVIDEQARMDDGLLSLYSLRPQRVWELLTLAPLLRDGKQRHDRRIYRVRGREIRIHTRPKGREIHADGDPVGRTPATFRILPGVIEVFVPPEYFHT